MHGFMVWNYFVEASVQSCIFSAFIAVFVMCCNSLGANSENMAKSDRNMLRFCLD